jgi:hypothetical protein
VSQTLVGSSSEAAVTAAGAAAEGLHLVGGDRDVAGDVEGLAAAGAGDLGLERDRGAGGAGWGVTWPRDRKRIATSPTGRPNGAVVGREGQVLALALGDAGELVDRQGGVAVGDRQVGRRGAGVGDEDGEAGAVGLGVELGLDGPEVAALGALQQGGGVAGAEGWQCHRRSS